MDMEYSEKAFIALMIVSVGAMLLGFFLAPKTLLVVTMGGALIFLYYMARAIIEDVKEARRDMQCLKD